MVGVTCIVDGKDEWESAVQASPHTIVFHRWDALSIIARYSRSRLSPLGIYDGKDLVGGIPIFTKSISGVRCAFSPPPGVGLPRLGPFLIDGPGTRQYTRESYLRDLYNGIDEYIRDEVQPDYCLFSSSDLADARWLKWRQYTVTPTYNYRISLNRSSDEIWSSIRRKTRGDITRARRRGFSVRPGERGDVSRIFSLLQKRYADQGRDPHVDPGFLLAAYDTLAPDSMSISVVERERQLVSGLIDTRMGARARTWIGLGKAEEHANDLLVWESLERAHQEGCQEYGVMGVAGTERLYHYYAKFNPDLFVSFQAERFSRTPAGLLVKAYLHFRRSRRHVKG